MTEFATAIMTTKALIGNTGGPGGRVMGARGTGCGPVRVRQSALKGGDGVGNGGDAGGNATTLQPPADGFCRVSAAFSRLNGDRHITDVVLVGAEFLDLAVAQEVMDFDPQNESNTLRVSGTAIGHLRVVKVPSECAQVRSGALKRGKVRLQVRNRSILRLTRGQKLGYVARSLNLSKQYVWDDS